MTATRELSTLVTDETRLVRAWVNFNGTGTVAIRASFNVSSITDLGVGTYALNFQSSMNDTNYAAIATAGIGTTLGVNDTSVLSRVVTNGFQINSFTIGFVNSAQTAFVDAATIGVAIFR